MDKELRRLKRTLAAEKCPKRVLTNVRQEIQRTRDRAMRRRTLPILALSAGALGLFVLAIFLLLPRQELDLAAPKDTAPAIDHARVAEETTMSLACIGHALMEAGNSTEAIIKEQTVPILRNSLEKLKQSLSKQI